MQKKFTQKLGIVALITVVIASGIWLVVRTAQGGDLSSKAQSGGIVTIDPKRNQETFAAWRQTSKAWQPAKVAYDEARALLDNSDYGAAEAACRRSLSLPGPKERTLRLLGEIYIEQGRNREALPYLGQAYRYGRGTVELDMDVALVHCRLGDLDKARQQFDSEKWLLRFRVGKPEELPGTLTAKTLEASILFARGMQYFLTGRESRAVRDYAAAARIVPTNGLLANYQGKALRDLKRDPEALQCFAIAATFAKGKTLRRATSSLAAWPAAEREKALKEAAKLKAAKS